MISQTRQQLLFLGEVLGTDAVLAIQIWKTFEDLEKLAADGSSGAKEIINALNLLHDFIAVYCSPQRG